MACIMDGNRRWAIRNKLQSWLGHSAGVKAAQHAIDFCLEQTIPHLSLYTFSLENFNRSESEKTYLFSLIITEIEKYTDELLRKNIKILFVGKRELFPHHVLPNIEKIEYTTQHHTQLTIYIAFCYGSQQEITDAVKRASKELSRGTLTDEMLTPEKFNEFFWSHPMPSPDLIVRTGGVQRLSNFLLYQAAYAELYFTDCLWPDITKEELKKALDFFNKTHRNFGL